MKKVAVVLVGLMLAGCKDEAKPMYDDCLRFESTNKLRDAYDSCRLAVGADPDSKAGKAAGLKVDDIKKRYDAQLKEDEDRRRVEGAKEEAARNERYEAELKVREDACTSHQWVTICDIGAYGSGNQVFDSFKKCDSIGKELKVKCDPCRCF